MNTLNDAFSLCMLMTWTIALSVLIAYGILNLAIRSMMSLPTVHTKAAAARNVAEVPAVARGAVAAMNTSSQLAA